MNQRDELLSYLLEREGFERQSEYTVPRRDNDDAPPPLSFAQERFWFLDQFEHSRPVYNGCKVVRLIGQLSIEALAESLNLIVRRHEVLRTIYPAPGGTPIQRVKDTCSVDISITDLRHVSESELPRAIERLARNEWLQPINLAEELPIRARLVRINPGQNLLILTLHQIVFDSQSIAIFFRELWTAYEATLHGKEPPLAALPVQYADFASWQRRRVSNQSLQSQREYWMQRLSGNLPLLNLPTDKPRPPLQGFDGSRLSILLPRTLQLKLKELSRENGVTAFMTLLAAFKTLLYRYTALQDLLVGCPVLNRRLPETENLLGSFINTLVLRTNYAGNPSFREALRRIRETCIGAFAHQDFPFEKLVEELHPERDVSRNPIFQVMFAFQNTSILALDVAGLRSEHVDIDGGMTKFDLTFSLIDKEHGIAGHIEYSTDLFHRDTIERMAQHFQTLLEGIVADPAQPISKVPIMPEPERHQILVRWNDTATDYPQDERIHELFEEQVGRTPEAIALEYQDNRVTYQELNRKANQLAHYLIGLGVSPERLVGICVERSIEMVVGLLGILKAGGAYVPLDPSYPEERLRFMRQDAQISVLLTTETLVEDREWRIEDGDPPVLRPGSGQASILDPRLKIVCLDRDWENIAQHSTANTECRVESESLAYVIYTSGSTGTPKGVQVSHRSVVNCLHSIGETIALTRNDVFLAVTTISFDIAALEIFMPLIGGARVALANRNEALDGSLLLAKLSGCGATVMQATPSGWTLLLDAGWRGCEGFKILCGGDALSRELADQLAAGGAEVWNLYGPTETTIWSILAKVERGETPVPLGRPIANTQTYILDSNFQPVPAGVCGELYVGGDGLARGYLNSPELAAERFGPDPYSDHPGSRLYRTGDLARYRPNGEIEFLGRIDHQVKIRGYRIELGEVEAALSQCPAVREAVVVAQDNITQRERASDDLDSQIQSLTYDKRLVAYIVPASEPTSTTEVREFLSHKLPEFMVPSIFVFVKELPLTPNGKVDRKSLPFPAEEPNLAHEFIEPRTEIEELVAQVWREVLKLDKIGIHDNFFELGGHSLLATRVMARLRVSFNIDIALRKLFELPTVAALAEHIEHSRQSQFGTSIAPIVPVGRTQPLPLSFSQRRLWYLQKVDANLSAYNIPAAFRVKGDLDSTALELALNEMVERHEVLRCYVKEVGGQPRQEILPRLRIALPVIDLTRLPGAEAEAEAKRLSRTDARQLYDLANAPLMRATLVKLAVDDHVLILNFHHIIADGSSLASFYRELAVLYEALRNNKTVSLPRLPLQYADYAAWQHEWLKSSSFDTQLGYWKRQLVSLPESCGLPTDFSRVSTQTWRGARCVVELSEELTRSLKTLSRGQSVTMFMTLVATFNILLSRISGQEDIVIGSTIAGRNHPDTAGLIGFFINALPLRTDLAGDPTFVTLLRQVREVCLEAYTNQDVPFEKIVEKTKPRRKPGRNPIFDILFNVADTSDRLLTLAGCEVTKLVQADSEAKFDIVLHAPEVGGKTELAVVYNTALFREERITLLLQQWAALLGQIARHPELPIGRFSLLTNAVRAVLPDPREPLDDSWEGAIHKLLAQQAHRSPESLSVVDENQSWTYEELNQCANRLAHTLIESGIRPKDLIAVYAHRSSSLIIALFGILKAGGSFLILDPAYPAARTIDYLRIAQPKGLLQLNSTGELPDELLSCLDSLMMACRRNLPQPKAEILQSLGASPNSDPATIVTADDPAYVAFTSGSTGEPKGVLCRHGPVTHFLPWQMEAFQLSAEDRFAMLSGLAYGHLHRDVFTALSIGATLYIPNPGEARSPEYLIDWLERNLITVLHLTPALGQLLLTSSRARLPAVRRVFFGGDVLTGEMVASIRRLAPNATVGSFYGATETQRAVGYFEIANDPAAAQVEALKAVPLGRGIKDVQLLVLNRGRQLAGVGELGELYVRSPHLAGGYINDEERTNESFITNPFTNDPEDRLYRTGELGRYLADGNVEWAGRNDRRVNIRGFRVELEEIESVLKQHPIVKGAAVVMQEYEIPSAENPRSETRDPKPDQRLVAYVAAEENQQSIADLLRSFLSARLPDYMVPGHIFALDHLPLSPNGKVVYEGLPPMVDLSSTFETSSGLPRTQTEQMLCQIFSEVLGREQVDVNDNFFRLGGHSLLAAQVESRVRERLGISMSLRMFFEVPTVAALARQVELLSSAGQRPGEWDKDEREEIEL